MFHSKLKRKGRGNVFIALDITYASTVRNERTTLYHQRNFVLDAVTVLLIVKLILKISVTVDLATRVVSGGPTCLIPNSSDTAAWSVALSFEG